MQIDSCGYGAEGAFGFSIGSKGYVGTGILTSVGEFWEYGPTVTSIYGPIDGSMNEFLLRQNYPNPFNPSTTIQYDLAKRAKVEISVLNLLGQKVRSLVNRVQDRGSYSIDWRGIDGSGRTVRSGVYVLRMKVGDPSSSSKQDFVASRKIVLLK